MNVTLPGSAPLNTWPLSPGARRPLTLWSAPMLLFPVEVMRVLDLLTILSIPLVVALSGTAVVVIRARI